MCEISHHTQNRNIPDKHSVVKLKPAYELIFSEYVTKTVVNKSHEYLSIKFKYTKVAFSHAFAL